MRLGDIRLAVDLRAAQQQRPLVEVDSGGVVLLLARARAHVDEGFGLVRIQLQVLYRILTSALHVLDYMLSSALVYYELQTLHPILMSAIMSRMCLRGRMDS
jgi:hypothetical protein